LKQTAFTWLPLLHEGLDTDKEEEEEETDKEEMRVDADIRTHSHNTCITKTLSN